MALGMQHNMENIPNGPRNISLGVCNVQHIPTNSGVICFVDKVMQGALLVHPWPINVLMQVLETLVGSCGTMYQRGSTSMKEISDIAT